MISRVLRYVSIVCATVLAAGVGLLSIAQHRSISAANDRVRLTGLHAAVQVDFDPFGVPTIHAASHRDAWFALGFLVAKDRLFQLDLMRRKSSGRLAEVFGPAALSHDRRQRHYGFAAIAQNIVAALPARHRTILQAYVDGINQAVRQADWLPPEFLVLGYRPDPWSAADSILVALMMFQTLSISESNERMLTVMRDTLPPDVVAFLTPDTDRYTQPLIAEPTDPPLQPPIPTESIARLLDDNNEVTIAGAVDPAGAVVGSNSWAVSGTMTTDGRAILANDMHLPLAVPNIWYRANLNDRVTHLAGVTLPGVPLLIVGSNGRIAWGFTSALMDDLDLVFVQTDSDHPDQYFGPDGWTRFRIVPETIEVKGGAPVSVLRRSTVWGPLSPDRLLGRSLAIHWTVMQPGGVDFGLMDMANAASLEEGLAVMHRSGLPIMNVAMADDRGRIAWTLTGKIPKRTGFDGSTSRSWVDGSFGWTGMLQPGDLPRIVDPPAGFIVTANNRTVGWAFPYPLGHNYASGFRAQRIRERLQVMHDVTERDLFALQLDTTTDFYESYRTLALSILDENAIERNPARAVIRRLLLDWDGTAEIDSAGLALLVEFRSVLADAIFSPIVARCLRADPGFRYRWFKMDVPLQQILAAQPEAILPTPERNDNWADFLRSSLEASAKRLARRLAVHDLASIHWGDVNRVRIRHPFSDALPGVGWLLDMPADPLAGCRHCVRVARGRHGASQRLVVSPRHLGDAILHMPGGQSGHPLSEHYSDQQPYWVHGWPLPLVSDAPNERLELVPTPTPSPSSANDSR